MLNTNWYDFKYSYSNKLNERKKKCIEKKMFKVFSLTGLKIFKNLAYQGLKCKFFKLTEFAIVLIKLQRKFNTFFKDRNA